MANLLPQNVKKRLRREYICRTVVVAFVAAMYVLIAALVLLTPTYVSLKGRLEILRQTEAIGFNDDKSIEISIEKLNEARASLEILQQGMNTRKIPYGVFVTLFDIKHNTISLSRISYSRSDDKLNISGSAETRNDLKLFIDNIGEQDLFLPIDDFPYASLSAKENIPFSFSIMLVKNDEE